MPGVLKVLMIPEMVELWRTKPTYTAMQNFRYTGRVSCRTWGGSSLGVGGLREIKNKVS